MFGGRGSLKEIRKEKDRTKLSEIQDLCTSGKVKIVDFKFTDLPGTLQHISIPAQRFSAEVLTGGIGFDGSSIRGFAEIQESDMLLMPDQNTAFIDPVCKVPTASFICDVLDPVTRERYWRDPRYIAQKAETYMKSMKIADVAYFGPEAEFFVFDSVRFDQNQHSGYYYLESEEGAWNSGRDGEPNLGYRPRYKEGYFPAPPTDTLMDFRSTAIMKMADAGIEVEVHHHEVATGGQGEIGIKYQPMTKIADHLMLYKYVLKNCRKGAQQDGHIHAEAHIPGQWLGNARSHKPRKGRRQSVLQSRRIRATESYGDEFHRGSARALPSTARVHLPDDELVSTPRPGL